MSEAAAKTLLRVLPEQAPLRNVQGAEPSIFLNPMRWPPERELDPPRALRGLAQIVEGGLCHRCGSCVGICPTGVLDLDAQAYPRVKSLSACTDCDLCVKVCPGDQFDFREAYRKKFKREAELHDTHGQFIRASISHATEELVRENSTSGGLVTALLLDLLERGQIDGAIVIVNDDKQLWKGKPIVARTRAEILSAVKSKYAISPTNSVFSEIRQVPGKYALVGLPCQIHGFEKAAELDPRIRERVVLTIGLFCHAAIEHEAFEVIWQTLGEKAKRAVKFVSRIGKHPGAPHIELDDGTFYPVYFGDRRGYRPSSIEVINVLYRLYTPDRCLTCFDALAEFADISVGDPWLAPPEDQVDFYQGWSFELIRTERGLAAYQGALEQGKIEEVEITRKEALACNAMMAEEKHWRAFRVIETHKRQGRAIPQYLAPNEEFPRHSGLQFLKTELHMLSHLFCYVPRWRATLLRFLLGSGGYRLFWLNNMRRVFRVWRRDSAALLRRKIFGRS